MLDLIVWILTPAAAAAPLLDSITNASAELLAAPSILVAGSLEVDTTSQALSPADSLLVALWLYDSFSFGALV